MNLTNDELDLIELVLEENNLPLNEIKRLVHLNNELWKLFKFDKYFEKQKPYYFIELNKVYEIVGMGLSKSFELFYFWKYQELIDKEFWEEINFWRAHQTKEKVLKKLSKRTEEENYSFLNNPIVKYFINN